jgi:hypothetical protein
MIEAKEIKNLMQLVISKLDKVDKIDVLEAEMRSLRKQFNKMQDTLVGIRATLDATLPVHEKRLDEHTKQLASHERSIRKLFAVK